MKVLDLFEFERHSFRRQLKDFYETLDATELSYEVGSAARKQFFKKSQGRFLQIAKLKRGIEIEQALCFLGLQNLSATEIESGETPLKDRDFFLLCKYLGCAQETSVFIEKLEKAMTPGLREARGKTQEALQQYGFRFYDCDEG